MNVKRMILGLVITVPIIALLAHSLGRDARLIPSPLPGREAPDFELAVMDTLPPFSFRQPGPGEPVRLSDLRGEVVVVSFWASWCLTCRDQQPALTRVAERYRDRDVRFLGVLYNDRPGNATRWIRAMGGKTYPTLLDSRSSTAVSYGLTGVPETFFIARDGRVAHKQVGPVWEGLLVEWLDRLVAEEWEGEATKETAASPDREER